MIREIAEQIGITDRLKIKFDDNWENTLSLVAYKVLGHSELAGCVLWSETVYGVPELSDR